ARPSARELVLVLVPPMLVRQMPVTQMAVTQMPVPQGIRDPPTALSENRWPRTGSPPPI
ncbi:MAG: hypothetical protein JWQ64_3101, partial [Subtercola sp.]|nr:hypothetical protein [Subtercola sp.]